MLCTTDRLIFWEGNTQDDRVLLIEWNKTVNFLFITASVYHFSSPIQNHCPPDQGPISWKHCLHAHHALCHFPVLQMTVTLKLQINLRVLQSSRMPVYGSKIWCFFCLAKCVQISKEEMIATCNLHIVIWWNRPQISGLFNYSLGKYWTPLLCTL